MVLRVIISSNRFVYDFYYHSFSEGLALSVIGSIKGDDKGLLYVKVLEENRRYCMVDFDFYDFCRHVNLLYLISHSDNGTDVLLFLMKG